MTCAPDELALIASHVYFRPSTVLCPEANNKRSLIIVDCIFRDFYLQRVERRGEVRGRFQHAVARGYSVGDKTAEEILRR